MRRVGFATVSIGIGLLLGLIAGEALTRVFSLTTPLRPAFGNFVTDPHLPFRPRPMSRDTGRTDEFTSDYQHNSFGFRDTERQREKPAGTFRVLGLGDSFTYGVGAGFGETYLARLQTLLDGRMGAHSRVEVINAGIPRYFPEAERILLEQDGVSFHPDLILLGVLPNDVVDTHLGLDAVTTDNTGFLKTREAKALGRWGTVVYRYSYLGRLLLKVYLNRRSRLSEDQFFQSGGPYESDWLKMEAEFARIAAIGDSIGAKVVLMHIPQRGPWNGKSRYFPARFSAWAAERGIHFLDVLPAMERHPAPESLYYPQDGHCTPAGYAIVADTLFRYLTDKHLVP